MIIGSFMPKGSALWHPALEELASRFPGHEIVQDPAESERRIGELDAVLGGRLDHGIFARAERLKAVFVPFTGLNHLPIELLKERKVRAFNVHGNAESVAERALAMTLAFYGRLVEFHNDLRGEQWHGFWVGKGAEDEWSSIFRRKAAIFGTGAIGLALARLLKAFDCEVVGYRRRAEAALPANFDRIETDFRAAVEGAELLFIALPLTPKTRGLFSKEILLASKGKFLVNVGRGDIVDEEGLWLSLSRGVLKGAAVDTWYTYPQGGATRGSPSRFPIHTLPNVILSPHVGGSTAEANVIAARQTLENMAEWLSTGGCSREGNLEEMY